MRRVVLIVTSTSLLPLVQAPAQQVGPRIGVLGTAVTPARWGVGDLAAQDGDWLRLRVAGRAQPARVALRSLTRREVGRGQERAALSGASIGFGLGVIAGALTQLGKAPAGSGDASCGGHCALHREASVVQTRLIGGAVGSLLGAALGYAVKTERWEALPLGRAGVAVAPNGTGLGLSFAF